MARESQKSGRKPVTPATPSAANHHGNGVCHAVAAVLAADSTEYGITTA